MRLWGKILPLVAATALWVAADAAPAAAQAQGSITGMVVDATSGRALESAQVFIPALNMGGLSNNDGRFLLLQVPAGTHEVRVELIGYNSATQEVTVSAGQSAAVEFRLESTALRLQELVVTGVAGETPRVKLPFTVESVDFTDMPVPAPSAEGLIAGKVPGAKVVRGSGQPGSEGGILLRGPTTITGTQNPLIIVDGVITDNTLADISSLDVESVELVKGAAAASLYGSRAQNGVVQIRTKRGTGLSVDQSRIIVRNEYGRNSLEGRIPLSQNHPYLMNSSGEILGYYPGENQSTTEPHPIDIRFFYDSDNVGQTCRPEVDPTGTYCNAPQPLLNDGVNGATSNQAFQSGTYPYQLYDHIDAVFNPGAFYSGFAAVEGRTGSTNYRASFVHQLEEGVVELNDGFKLSGFRLNLDHQVLDNLTASVSTYYAQAEQDDLGGNPFYNLAFQAPFADLRQRAAGTEGQAPCGAEGCYIFRPDPLSQEENPLYRLELIDLKDDRQRFLGSAALTWSPLSWFELEGQFSLDQSSFSEFNITPEGLLSDQSGIGLGGITRYQRHDNDLNANFTASINRAFGDLTLRSRLRYSIEDQHRENFSVSGQDFTVAGVPQLDNLAQGEYTGSSYIEDVVAEGYYFITSFDYQGKYLGDVLVRRDGSSLFGPEERWQTYYRVSGAWRLAQEGWWPFDDVNEFKLRYSRGTAGGRPRFAAQYETYNVSAGSISPDVLGNRFLKPEHSTEQEFGLEMVFFNKLNAGVVYADSRVEDQLLFVPLLSSAGFTDQWQNAGTLESNTIEAWLETAIIDNPDFTWTSRVNFDRTRQEIVELNTIPYQTGFLWVAPGENLGSFYGAKWARECGDLPAGTDCGQYQVNDDGLLVWTNGQSYMNGQSQGLWGSEGENGERWGLPIKATDPEEGNFLFLGNTTPDFNLSWSNTFRWGGLQFYTLLDGEFGADVYNQTRHYAYRDNRSADQDQAGKSSELQKSIDYYQILYNTNDTSGWFVEDGTFVKIREASLRYTLNQDLVDRLFGGIGINGLSVNLIGRNLLTFTDYQGYDPEAGTGAQGSGGGSEAIGRVDNFGYPNFRTFTASLELIF
ncbi:MAG TPA: SusC/RagA family TonB-linked outer membrane protein [Longimicrobiales bacterium]|nr:SusC/RagA family TonB-linked outer membrane protein [Longimicrobiales bacterium]